MGYITRENGRFGWGQGEPPVPREPKVPRLDEMGASGCWIDIDVVGRTVDGVTPVMIRYLEHSVTGFLRRLDIPGRIVCEADEFYYLDEIFDNTFFSITTMTECPHDGEVIKYWHLMAGDPDCEQYLEGCYLETDRPIRAFTYNEVYGGR